MLICPKCKKVFQNSKMYCCYCGTALEEKDNRYDDSILDVTKKMIELCEKEDLLEVEYAKSDRPRIRPKHDTGWFNMKTEPEKYRETVNCLTRIAEIIKENYSYLEENSKGYKNNLKVEAYPNAQSSMQIDFYLRVLGKKEGVIGDSTTILRFALPFCDAKALLDLASDKDKKNIYKAINDLKKYCEERIKNNQEILELIEKGFQNISN